MLVVFQSLFSLFLYIMTRPLSGAGLGCLLGMCGKTNFGLYSGFKIANRPKI